MAERPSRIAMWSGPRNLSTAMMRSFGNRADVAEVRDEPFYAAYLAATGKDHPMRAEVLGSQSRDWREVARACATDPVPTGKMIYQKHMSQHMLPDFGREWMNGLCNVFLIRAPERVVASYAARAESVEIEDIGFLQQADLFDRLADRLGRAPPVIDSDDIRRDPRAALARLCAAIGLEFDNAMLHWAPGRRPEDGVWAAHWYASVEKSTGFAPPEAELPALDAAMQHLAVAARPAYEKMRAFAL